MEKCDYCGKVIPRARIEAQPMTKTCSRACAEDRKRRVQRDAQRRLRELAKRAEAVAS